MAKVWYIKEYDEQSIGYGKICKYTDEILLFASGGNIYKYYIKSKIREIIYSVSYDIIAIGYINGNIYTARSEYKSYAGGQNYYCYIDKINIDTLELTSNVMSDQYSDASLPYTQFRFFIKNDTLYLTIYGYKYYHNTSYGPLSYYDYGIYTNNIEGEGSTSKLSFIDNTRDRDWTLPYLSVFEPEKGCFVYTYNQIAKAGYMSSLPPTNLIDVEETSFVDNSAFEDDDYVYILKRDELLSFNKINNVINKIADNPTSLIPISYVYCDGKYYGATSSKIVEISTVEYNLEYSFSDGENIVTTVNNLAPITNIFLSYTGNNVTIELTQENGNKSIINYDVKNVEGKRFYGLSTTPNQKEAYILQGNTEVYIDKNVTFYPVYESYRPPSRIFQLNLYKNSAEPNRVDKTNYLTQIGTLYGAFRDETSVTNMVINIQQEEFPQFNYVYIPTFHRYYFVTDITSIRQNLWEISLSVDVLMTYKDGILDCEGFVDRNEFSYNEDLIDKKRVIESGYNIERFTITNDLFNPDSIGDFVLEGLGFGSLVGDLYSITTDLTNVTASAYNPTNIGSSEQVTLGFIEESGYLLPEEYDTANFSVTNATVVSWSGGTGILVISNATGNVTITIKGVAING